MNWIITKMLEYKINEALKILGQSLENSSNPAVHQGYVDEINAYNNAIKFLNKYNSKYCEGVLHNKYRKIVGKDG